MKKMKYKRILLSVAMAFAVALTPAAAFGGTTVNAMAAAPDTSWYNGGAGPFSIATADQLAGLAQLVNGGDDFSGKTVVLTADIDLSGYAAGAGWMPIGYGVVMTGPGVEEPENPFNGTFDGAGYKITGMSISRPLDVDGTTSPYPTINGGFGVALFGCVGAAGAVKNFTVDGSAITDGTAMAVGGVAGWNEGAVTNCGNTGTVTGASDVGGVVGLNNGGTVTGCFSAGAVGGVSAVSVGGVVGGSNGGLIDGCSNASEVNGDINIGGVIGVGGSNAPGVIGTPSAGTISNCSNTGNVTGNIYVGGVTGRNNGPITGCHNTGAVIGSGSGGYVGGVAGDNNGPITGCYNTGAVSGGSNNVGGIAGINEMPASTIDNCYNTGAVTGASGRVGGVVGFNYYGAVTGSYNTGAVSGAADYVGGVAGINSDTVTGCYNFGKVSGLGSNTGGVAGRNESGATVDSCYNAGAVTGLKYVGGVVGQSYGTVSNCYNTGAVVDTDGINPVGGVVGSSYGDVSNCYNAGLVSGSSVIGGVTGENYSGIVTNCYYDSTVNPTLSGISGESDAPGITTGLLTSDMTDPGTLDSGAGVMMADINGDGAFVKPDYTSGSNGCATAFYPELAVFANSADPTGFTQAMSKISVATDSTTCTLGTNEQYFTQGDGTSGDPYLIYTAQQLNHVREHLNGAYFKLMADINLSGWNGTVANAGNPQLDGNGWVPIGTYTSGSPDVAFTGDFNGNGHIIQNITIDRPGLNCVGLFGDVGSGGAVYGLGIVDGSVTGGDSVGGVTGVVGYEAYATGTVENCYNTAVIIGNSDYVGGVVGHVQPTGLVTGCYNTGSVSSAGSKVGGVAGSIDNPGAVEYCYSVGTVTGAGQVGGAIGNNGGTVTGCYYDSETSGVTNGIGSGTGDATGLTTAQMVAVGTLTGDMSGLNAAGSAFTKRPTDSVNCYYPELSVFYADPAATTAQLASKASVQVARRTPAVTASATAIDQGQTLAASTLSGSATDPVNSNAVDGTFAWTNSALVPDVGTASFAYTFTPDFADLYFSVNATAQVTVNAATGSNYVITSGAESSWKIGTSAGLTIVSNGNISNFTGIQVDGALIDSGNYTAVSGSTIVTFKPAYLSTLAVGRHTVTFVYTDGSVSTGLTILAAGGTTPAPSPGTSQGGSPLTGDNSDMALWALICLAALAAAGGLIVSTRRKRSCLKTK